MFGLGFWLAAGIPKRNDLNVVINDVVHNFVMVANNNASIHRRKVG